MIRMPTRVWRTFVLLAGLLVASMLTASPCCATVHGTVSDAVTHKPVAGVAVYVLGLGFSPPPVIASTVSAQDGSYSLPIAIGSGFTIFANALGYADFEAPSPQRSALFNIALTPVAAIGGTVFGPGAQPMEASVVVLDAATGNYVNTLFTDDAGKYGYNDITPGRYMVCVISSFDIYQDACYDHQQIGADGIPNGTPVDVAAQQFVTGVDVHLQIGATISGTATDRASHGPLYGYVRFMLYTPAGELVTSIDNFPDVLTGNYQIAGFAPGNYYLVAETPFSFDTGYYPHLYGGADCDPTDPSGLPACSFTGVSPLTVPAQGLTHIDFDLSAGGSVSGYVRDAATGLGIPNAQVDVCTLPNYMPTAGAITDANGFYVITHVLQKLMVSTRVSGYIDEVWPATLYDGTSDCASDDPQSFLTLPTTTGSLSDINFSLTQGTHISGVVSGTQETPAHIAFFIRNTFPAAFVEEVAANPDGSFVTTDLTTAQYPSDYTAIAWLDDGVTCVVYGGGSCGPAWQASDPSTADTSEGRNFQAGLGTVILNLDFNVNADRLFRDGFE